MPFINFTNPITILLALILFILVLFLGKETHKSAIAAVMLFAFLAILVGHTVELMVIKNIAEDVYISLTRSIVVDFVFIFLSFISYLWIDDIQAKVEKKKSIDNSLDWFWSKV